MSKKTPTNAEDPRFHHEIWKGPSVVFDAAAPISYVENHNAPCGYSEVAFDFTFAVDLLLKEYLATRTGNWVAPVVHLSRQVIELRLKAIMQTIGCLDVSHDTSALGSHDLMRIWDPCRAWLLANGYPLSTDARLDTAERLIAAFHAIDPAGDLFRFGVARALAFGRQKSVDRVGIEAEAFEREFCETHQLLEHWETAVLKNFVQQKQGLDLPFFDADNFPKRK